MTDVGKRNLIKLMESRFADFPEAIRYVSELIQKEALFDEKPKGGWKLHKRGDFIDIICPCCHYLRVPSYSYGCSVEDTLNHLKTVDTQIPAKYCEHCGAYLMEEEPAEEDL